MTTHDFDLGIIGGGAAGLTVAAGAARLGARTLLIEKEPSLGGDCLHYGCVPSKTLIHTAHVYHQLGKTADYGLPAVVAGPVDFRRVRERIRSVIAQIQHHDSVERFCGLGVQVEFGTPEFRDEHAVRLHGATRSARYWVIATGSSPAAAELPALQKISCLSNREIFSLERLPATMLILGAGPIAMEMAQAFQRLGTRVRVIQRSGQVLSKEDKDLADTVLTALQNEGVAIHLHSRVIDAGENGSGKWVTVQDQEGRQTTHQAEAILLAQGRTANTAGLGLERIGVALTPAGISVDNRLRTSHKHIFAAGDVTGAHQFTHAAGYEGGVVLANAVFRLPRRADYTLLPWCTYTDPELASIGLNEKRAQAAGIAYTVWSEEFRDNDRAVAEGRPAGRIKMLLGDREKLLGVQIAGPRAGDLLAEWVAVMGGGVKLSTLAGAVHPYPTLAEINKRVAGSFLSGKLFSGTVRKGLRLFFQLKGPVSNPCSSLKP